MEQLPNWLIAAIAAAGMTAYADEIYPKVSQDHADALLSAENIPPLH